MEDQQQLCLLEEYIQTVLHITTGLIFNQDSQSLRKSHRSGSGMMTSSMDLKSSTMEYPLDIAQPTTITPPIAAI